MQSLKSDGQVMEDRLVDLGNKLYLAEREMYVLKRDLENEKAQLFLETNFKEKGYTNEAQRKGYVYKETLKAREVYDDAVAAFNLLKNQLKAQLMVMQYASG